MLTVQERYSKASLVLFFDIDNTIFVNCYSGVMFTGYSVQRWRDFLSIIRKHYPAVIFGIITAKQRAVYANNRISPIYRGKPDLSAADITRAYDIFGARVLGYDHTRHDVSQTIADFIEDDFVYFQGNHLKSEAMKDAHQNLLGAAFDTKKMWLIDDSPGVFEDMHHQGCEFNFFLVPKNVYTLDVSQRCYDFEALEKAGIQFFLAYLRAIKIELNPCDEDYKKLTKQYYEKPPLVSVSPRAILRLFDYYQDWMHVLMPVRNASQTILEAIYSVFNQTYACVRLIIYDDNCTDDSFGKIEEFKKANPDLSQRMLVLRGGGQRSVASIRSELVKFSKSVNTNAYILWLNGYEKILIKSFINELIYKMQRTKSDICFYSFEIRREGDIQEMNPGDLREESARVAVAMNYINQDYCALKTVRPLDLGTYLDFYNIECGKCYAPTAIELHENSDDAFVDVIFMAKMVKVNLMTALEKVHINYVQHYQPTVEMAEQYSSRFLLQELPRRLTVYFNTVLVDSRRAKDRLQAVDCAMKLFLIIAERYAKYIEDFINEDPAHDDITQNTLKIYKLFISRANALLGVRMEALAKGEEHLLSFPPLIDRSVEEVQDDVPMERMFSIL